MPVDFSLNEAERELVALCHDFAQNEIARRAPVAWNEARCPTDLLHGYLVPADAVELFRAAATSDIG